MTETEAETGSPAPPVANRRPVRTVHHGIARIDDHAWLRAENWREVMTDPGVLAPDIRAYLEAENTYTKARTAGLDGLRAELVGEMRGRIREDDSSVPAPDGDYAYWQHYRDGGQHPIVMRRRLPEGEDETVLDGDRLAEGRAYFRLGGRLHSPDHRLYAYAADETGAETFTIRIIDAATGEAASRPITGADAALVWDGDGTHLFYVERDENHRPRRVMRHAVGGDGADVLVYEEDDPGFFVGIGKTRSGRFLVISSHDHETSDIRVIPADAPETPPRQVIARKPGREAHLDHHGDRLIVRTNEDAEDFRIASMPADWDAGQDGDANWTDIVSHRAGRLIVDHVVFANHLVLLERENALPRIAVHRLSDGATHAVAFDEAAYALGLSPGFEFETATLRFSYSSPTTPSRVYDYDLETRDRALRKEQEVPSGHRPEDYRVARVQAAADDGETVPVTVLWRHDTPIDGTAPCLLYGYGAYGISMPAGFSTNILSLVDRGFVFAIAHIRGGMEKGYRWYREGKREKKVNTFTDFLSAGDALIADGYTSAGRIVAHGGSAGGLLVGAAVNMRPDLFAGVVGEVPFVDTLTTMLDDSLPLTPPEWPEWGNPIESADDYRTIAAYSPIDNVAARPYPAILATGGLSDPRVTYWEPAKWVAALRARTTGDRPILLKTNMEAGHGGASGRFDRLEEIAFVHAFALMAVGHADAGGDG